MRLRPGRFGALSAIVTAACLVVAAGTTAALAASGDLDPTFGDDGRVISGWDGWVEDPGWELGNAVFGRAFDVDVQADGRIVLVGALNYGDAFALARHETNGSLDVTFGEGGVVTTTFAPWSAAFDAAIQDDGKIVAVGATARTGYAEGLAHDVGRGGRFAVARYETDGDLDPTFGSDGRVRTRFGRRVSAFANGVAIQPDGSVVVVGTAGRAIAIARYLSDGTLDPSFSSDGRIRVRVVDSPATQTASGVAVLADGTIRVGGVACAGRSCDAFVAGFGSDGSRDTTFGNGGAAVLRVMAGLASSFAVQPDGKLILGVGRTLYRFDADGALDMSFSDDGWTRTGLTAAGIAVDASGRVVIAGPAGREITAFAVARLDPAGLHDERFGGDGRAEAEFPGFLNTPLAVAIQPDGKIVAAGTTADFEVDGAFAVARFLG